jgi:predicted ATP-dependent endonuclease of OLD family
MYLSELSAANYRTLGQFHIQFNDKVNVLVGPNGSGKSNILSAINSCFYTLFFKELRLEQTDHSFHAVKKGIALHARIRHLDKIIDLQINTAEKSNSDHIKIDGIPNGNLMGYYHLIPSSLQGSGSIVGLRNSRRGLREKFEFNRYSSDDLLFDYFDLSTKNPEELKTISKIISRLYPGFEDLHVALNVQQEQATLQAVIDGFAFGFQQLSSGLQHLIQMISTIHFSKNSVILIDEPELHMNPKMIIGVAQLIKDSSENNNNQFILGTHSSSLLTTPGIRIIPLEYKNRNTCIAKSVDREFVDGSFLNPK